MTEDKKNSLKEIIKENSQTLTNLENQITKNAMAKIKNKLTYYVSSLTTEFEEKVEKYMNEIKAHRIFKDLTPEEKYIYLYLQTMLINNELAKEIKNNNNANK